MGVRSSPRLVHPTLLLALIPVFAAACGDPLSQNPAPNTAAASSAEAVIVVAPDPQEEPKQDNKAVTNNDAKQSPEAEESIETCLSWVQNGRGLPSSVMGKPDEAVYAQALQYQRAGKFDSAKKEYLKLIQQYPKSLYIPLAYFAFGEMFLQEADSDPAKIEFAVQSYQEAMKYPLPDNTAYLPSAFHLAIAFNKKNDPAYALAQLKKVLEAGIQYPNAQCAGPLGGSARAQMAAAYASAGRPEVAYQFFRNSAGESHAYSMIGLLCDHYVANKKPREAASALMGVPKSKADSDYCTKEEQVIQNISLGLDAKVKAELTGAHKTRCPSN